MEFADNPALENWVTLIKMYILKFNVLHKSFLFISGREEIGIEVS
jgi:hypothetical protein